MQHPQISRDEAQRLAALRRSNLMDTPREVAFDRIAELASQLFATRISLVTLVGEERLWFKSKIGTDHEDEPRETSFCSHAIDGDEVMVVNDASQDERFANNPWVTAEPQMLFYAGAPLRTAEGHTLGTLCVLDGEPRTSFTVQDKQKLQHLADIAIAQIETRRAVGYIDAETGVYTRQRMLDELRGQARQPGVDGHQQLVAVVDVAMSEHISELIQTLGYQYTEQFILETIRRLADIIGQKSDLYRIGLSRFGFLISDYAGPITRSELDRLAEALSQPIDCAGIPVAPIATIGVVDLRSDAQDPAEEALRRATMAADEALRRNRWWCFYDSRSDKARQRKFRLVTDLPAALNAMDQLSLQYQPKIDLASGDCCGVEALLRWQHPHLGHILPAELVSAAQKTALMRRLTDWVLSTALKQAAKWKRAGMPLQVAVNVSVYDLIDTNLASRVSQRLQDYGLGGDALELEFTEGSLNHNLEATIPRLRDLHDLGVSTTIDDFGIGACNLTYLQKIPADKIKIDRSFINLLSQQPRDRELTRAIIDLAHSLDFRLVAEGIETQATLEVLANWGCEQAQGYLFSEPLDPLGLTAWLRRREGTDQTGLAHRSG